MKKHLEARKHCTLAVVRWSQKYVTYDEPEEIGRHSEAETETIFDILYN